MFLDTDYMIYNCLIYMKKFQSFFIPTKVIIEDKSYYDLQYKACSSVICLYLNTTNFTFFVLTEMNVNCTNRYIC